MVSIPGITEIIRDPSGVPGMDQITGGGFPKETNILLLGPTGAGKSSMCIQFTKCGLELGEQVLYISTQLPLYDMRAKMRQLGLDTGKYEDEGNLVLVNPLSMEISGADVDEKMQAARFVEVEQNITTIAGLINEGKRKLMKDQIRIVIDSLTGLLLNTSDEGLHELYRLIETITRRVRLQKHVALFTLAPAIDERTIERLKFIMDGVMEFKVELDLDTPERKLIIHNLLFTDKAIGRYNYILTPDGIILNRY
ncbi:MAG: RecA-superfamily ATPase, KaiC/GvpD/RAD55 family [Candidatus Methanocomedens sp.]|nr:MAG: RecA-superfamily ATPase, KaiC/GvpD/RAD55 family [ANME-2 cluster archaeon]